MITHDCEFLPLARIRPTEEVCLERVDEVVAMIMETRSWTRPICVEATIGALLDGHHRFAAAQALGLTHVPVHIFDYAEVTLASWRPEVAPTRDEVLARALSGELYPYKTTRHVFSTRIARPIPMSELFDLCREMADTADTALGSGLLFQQSDVVGPMGQDRRQG